MMTSEVKCSSIASKTKQMNVSSNNLLQSLPTDATDVCLAVTNSRCGVITDTNNGHNRDNNSDNISGHDSIDRHSIENVSSQLIANVSFEKIQKDEESVRNDESCYLLRMDTTETKVSY